MFFCELYGEIRNRWKYFGGQNCRKSDLVPKILSAEILSDKVLHQHVLHHYRQTSWSYPQHSVAGLLQRREGQEVGVDHMDGGCRVRCVCRGVTGRVQGGNFLRASTFLSFRGAPTILTKNKFWPIFQLSRDRWTYKGWHFICLWCGIKREQLMI